MDTVKATCFYFQAEDVRKAILEMSDGGIMLLPYADLVDAVRLQGPPDEDGVSVQLTWGGLAHFSQEEYQLAIAAGTAYQQELRQAMQELLQAWHKLDAKLERREAYERD